MTRRAVAAAPLLGAVVALALAACTPAPAADESASTVAVERSVVAETTSDEDATTQAADVPMTVEEAGEYYLVLVEPTNTLLDEFDAAIAVSDMPGLRDVSGELAQGYEEFVEGLRTAVWPAEVAPAVEALALELEAEVPAWQAIADAGTDQDTADRLAELPVPGTAAQLIRTALGLDGAPVG
ncbi:hypothetical protein [Actinotalea solisilvae]|uniref:hypothetical protein n=1 Tax=Actinotalea solisilvae TaxID=2072922 RepID=UPI0018F159B0|nr:hypothetical protein [Actinotalea solisilvae]